MTQYALSKGDRRRDSIMQALKRQGRITIQDIVDTYGCSEATARRDLDVLERQGGIIRSFGGAQLDPGALVVREVPFREKKELLLLEKEAIARRAASLVEEGDIVALTGGTTTTLIARELQSRSRITVVTNAVNIAMELSGSEGVQVVLTGGVMRHNSYELCGPLAEKIVEGIHIAKMFMGIDGIAAEQGLTTFSEQEADIARLMQRRSQETYAVFDHTKAGRTSLFGVTPLSSVTGCITNRSPSGELAAALEQLSIPVYLGTAELPE